MINIKKSSCLWGRDDFRIFFFIFFLGFVAKGAAAFRGMSIDDYSFSLGMSEWSYDHFLSQGRFFGALASYAIESIGVNLNDAYFSMAFFIIALQAALAVSVMRLVGCASFAGGVIIGGLMTLHPYGAEFLTFKHILPVYALALIFSIFVIESIKVRSKSVGFNVGVTLAVTAALMAYQASLNYLLVAAFGCLLMSTVSKGQDIQSGPDFLGPRSNGWLLFLFSFFGALLFLGSLWLVKYLGFVGSLSGRESFIGLSEVSKRLDQIFSALDFIFLKSEPVFPIALKVLYIFLLFGSVVLIAASLLRGWRNFYNMAFGFLLLVLIPVLSIGIVIPLNEWWLVPRVVAHNSLLFGVILLVAERSVAQVSFNIVRPIFVVGGSLLLIGFIFVNNQIFADQQTVAQWDRFKANRIVARLEEIPDFNRIQRLYVHGGKWGYPVGLRTLQGDMNISAFFPSWSKRPLVLESTGYKFGRPSATEAEMGAELCLDRNSWPDKDSVFIRAELAIVCLER